MFSKATYTARREELKKLVKDGIILLFGNNDSPFKARTTAIRLSDRILLSCTISDRSATDWSV